MGVLGLIALLFYALRKLNKRVSIGTGSKLRVLDRVNLGRDGMLLVISVNGKLMLVGSTPQRIEKLCDLDMTEEEYSSLNDAPDFKTVFSSLWKKNPQENGGSEDSNPHKSSGSADGNPQDNGGSTDSN